MRFVHASDLLVGLDLSHVAEKAEELRAQRLLTVRSLLQMAASKRAQFILLSGNTLADPRVSRDQVKNLLEILQTSQSPVYLLPGVRDPLSGSSPYLQDSGWRSGPVYLLDGPLQLDEAFLQPIHFPRKPEEVPEKGPRCRIAVGCLPPEDLPSPFQPEEFDYIAMGGSTRPRDEVLGTWPGSPEPTQFSDLQGKVNLVTWESGSGIVKIQPKKVGTFSWSERTESVKDLDRLKTDLDGIPNPSQCLLKLSLKGNLSEPELVRLLEYLQEIRGRFYSFEVDNQVSIRESPENRFRNSLLIALSQRLRRHLADEPAVTRHAILRLRQILSQSGQSELE